MAPNALAQQLDDLDRRVSVVEQVASSAQVAGDPIPANTEVVDDATGDIVTLTLAPPDVPTDVVATPGTFFENIFADITWTAPVGDPPDVAEPSSYQVELAERTAGPTYDLVDLVVSLAPNARFNSLKPNKDYSVRVTAVSVVGRMSAPTAWVDFTTGADATLPATPTGLNVFRGADSIIASWNENAEPDVAHGHGLYQVELSADNFATVLQSYRTAATVLVFEGLFTEATYKVRVAAIDSSNNQSAAWATSANTTGGAIITTMIKDDAITTPKIVAGAIITDRLAAGAVTAAKIQAGTITANEIAANTITADKLTTSSLTSANITLAGGSFKAGNPPTTGVLLNSQGIRLYSGGVVQVALDVSGTASFSGSVTASAISGSTVTGTTITGGSISGTTITGSTITGGTVQTATTAPRIRMLNHPTAGAPIPAQTGASAGEYLEFHTGYLGSTSDDYNPGIIFSRSYNASGTQAGTLHLVAPRPLNTFPLAPEIQMQTFLGGVSFGQINVNAGNFVIGGRVGGTGGDLYVSGSLITNTVGGTNTFNGTTTFSGTTVFASLSINSIGTISPHPSFSTSILYQSSANHYWRSNTGTDLMGLTFNQFTVNVASTFNSNLVCNGTTTLSTTNLSGNLDIAGNALTGSFGGTNRAANLRTRNGLHHVHFDYTAGGQLQFWVDGSSIAYIAFGAQVNSGTKSFIVDHPMDPSRYLVHACLEGPTSDVYYHGRGKLRNGQAWIELPGYFEAFTREEGRTVQVTPMNSVPSPLCASEPRNGRFRVFCSNGKRSNASFSWEVKAIRKDTATMKVEPLKSEVEVRGFGPYKFYSDAKPTNRQGALDAVEAR